MSSDTKSSESRSKLMNSHNWMLVFAIIFLFLATVGALALSGAQTGSCYTSGLGSAIQSSTGGEPDQPPTASGEVTAEFFIFVLLIIGVAMITYILVVKKKANQLLDEGEPKAALIINGKKDNTKEDIKNASKDQLTHDLKDAGISMNAFSTYMKTLSKKDKKYMKDQKNKNKSNNDVNKSSSDSNSDSDSDNDSDN